MNLKIHSSGKIYFYISLIFTSIIFLFSLFFGIVLLILSIYIFYFFRDPIRIIPKEDLVLSPADGIVTFIGEVDPPNELNIKNKFIKISIFLSIFNVHVNRIPVDGIIKKINYIAGKFLNATLDKSSTENERNIILIETKDNEQYIVTQIAGLIARRIVSDLKENQEVIKGHKFGIIKFGSRVDLYIPAKFKPLVNKGQTVIGGETIIANPNNISEITTVSSI